LPFIIIQTFLFSSPKVILSDIHHHVKGFTTFLQEFYTWKDAYFLYQKK